MYSTCQICGQPYGSGGHICSQGAGYPNGIQQAPQRYDPGPWPGILLDAIENRIMARLAAIEKKLDAMTKGAE
jgi:hypothetical protein